MSLEKNKAIVRRLFEAFNKQDLALLDELMAPDYVDHSHQLRGLEGFKQFLTMLIKGAPDMHVTIEDIIAEGDKVWVHVTAKGTHTGEYHGLAPTGKKITFTVVDIWRIVDSKVVEGWHVEDQLDLLRQLGVIEYTEKAKKLFPEDVK